MQGGSPKGGLGQGAHNPPTPEPGEACQPTGACSIPWGVAHRRTTEDDYRRIVAATRRRLRINPCRSTSELAGAVSCSKRTLNRAFAAAGSTVREERDAARLDRAANVLLAEKPAAEAARHARYASPRQLADPFRRRFGVTPAHMRRIGRAIRTIRWQAGRPGPYSGSLAAART